MRSDTLRLPRVPIRPLLWTHCNHNPDGNPANPDETVLRPATAVHRVAGPPSVRAVGTERIQLPTHSVADEEAAVWGGGTG